LRVSDSSLEMGYVFVLARIAVTRAWAGVCVRAFFDATFDVSDLRLVAILRVEFASSSPGSCKRMNSENAENDYTEADIYV
jgi:hypothetical protein